MLPETLWLGKVYIMQRKIQFSRLARRGFSFMEIMLVVLIIGILTAVVAPNFFGKAEETRITATKQQMDSIKTALAAYEFTTGQLPSTQQGIEALVRRPSGVPEEEWRKQMEELPRDAWGEKFIYKLPGEKNNPFTLISKGPDRKEGTEDDIYLFKKNEGFDD